MSRTHLKLSRCPNCDTSLKVKDNFCPTCGQQNHDLKVPFHHLLTELLESIFHFETKFFTTLKSIFTQPGQITRDFWEGKRARYMHPFRLYVFVSFIFFLVANKVANKKVDEIDNSIQKVEQNQSLRIVELDNLVGRGHAVDRMSRLKALGFEDFRGIDLTVPLDSVARRHFIVSLKQANDTKLDSLLSNKSILKNAENRMKLRQVLAMIPDTTNIPTSLDIGPINIYFRTLEERQTFTQNVGKYSNQEIDSLLVTLQMKPSSFNRTLLKQVSKFDIEEEHGIQNLAHVFMKNLSIVMFVLMPVVAFILLLVFRRRKRYYFEHLIFSIHANTNLFILFFLALSIDYFAPTEWLIIFAFLLGWIYFFLSLKTVYQQGWLTTFYKLLILTFLYSIVVMFFVGGAFFWGVMSF